MKAKTARLLNELTAELKQQEQDRYEEALCWQTIERRMLKFDMRISIAVALSPSEAWRIVLHNEPQWDEGQPEPTFNAPTRLEALKMAARYSTEQSGAGPR